MKVDSYLNFGGNAPLRNDPRGCESDGETSSGLIHEYERCAA